MRSPGLRQGCRCEACCRAICWAAALLAKPRLITLIGPSCRSTRTWPEFCVWSAKAEAGITAECALTASTSDFVGERHERKALHHCSDHGHGQRSRSGPGTNARQVRALLARRPAKVVAVALANCRHCLDGDEAERRLQSPRHDREANSFNRSNSSVRVEDEGMAKRSSRGSGRGIIQRASSPRMLGNRSANSIGARGHYARAERAGGLTAPDYAAKTATRWLAGEIPCGTRKRPPGRIGGRFWPARGLESGQSPADATKA